MAPHPLVNQPAPPLSLPDSNGDIFSFTPGTSGVPCALLFYPQSGMAKTCPSTTLSIKCRTSQDLTAAHSKHVNSEMHWQVCLMIPLAGWTQEDSPHICTAEKDLFKRSKVQVVGVSPDAVDKQKVFVDKQKLTVILLALKSKF